MHQVALRVAQVRHLLRSDHPGESLLFLCVVVNDCETLVTCIEHLEDEHLEELEETLVTKNEKDSADDSESPPGLQSTYDQDSSALYESIEEALSECMSKCGSTGTLALLQMQHVIFDDVESESTQLFSNIADIMNGTGKDEETTSEALQTMLLTLEDYFIGKKTIFPYFFKIFKKFFSIYNTNLFNFLLFPIFFAFFYIFF